MKEELLEAKAIVSKNLDIFVEKFLSELETEKNCKKRKTIARKVLMVFLGNYSSLVEGEAKTGCKEIMLHFSNSIGNIEENENLDSAIQQLVENMMTAMKMVENKEIVVRPIIFELLCIYAGLTVSDFDGAIKCHDLGKKISLNWKKYTPINVTLSFLTKREKKSKLPISELALLEKYSF